MDGIYPPGHLLSLLVLVILTSFISHVGAHQHDHGYGSTAERPYFISTGRGEDVYEPGFQSWPAVYETNVVTMDDSAARDYVVNVDDFGAKADGTDDSEAFRKAWNHACSSDRNPLLVVPEDKIYHLKPVNFSGPCRSHLQLLIYGTIKASVEMTDYENDTRHWLVFQNVTHFKVRGGGTINGNGMIWWIKSCKIDKTLPCKHAPNAMTFLGCKKLIVSNLRFLNAQQMHLSFQECVKVRASNLVVQAPGNSPNTDGIHVTGTQNIHISKCLIMTGDDCISIVSGSKKVQATDIICGPGHGISIGSLGANKSEATVSHVVVNRAMLSGTTNGVRIKTWQGGSGYAKKILFQNVVMHNVTNPILIDQNYCDQVAPCHKQAAAVKISHVIYRNIMGTSESEVAVNFNCSRSIPCQKISLQGIDLIGEDDGRVTASCVNVKLAYRGMVSPQCDIL